MLREKNPKEYEGLAAIAGGIRGTSPTPFKTKVAYAEYRRKLCSPFNRLHLGPLQIFRPQLDPALALVGCWQVVVGVIIFAVVFEIVHRPLFFQIPGSALWGQHLVSVFENCLTFYLILFLNITSLSQSEYTGIVNPLLPQVTSCVFPALVLVCYRCD